MNDQFFVKNMHPEPQQDQLWYTVKKQDESPREYQEERILSKNSSGSIKIMNSSFPLQILKNQTNQQSRQDQSTLCTSTALQSPQLRLGDSNVFSLGLTSLNTDNENIFEANTARLLEQLYHLKQDGFITKQEISALKRDVLTNKLKLSDIFCNQKKVCTLIHNFKNDMQERTDQESPHRQRGLTRAFQIAMVEIDPEVSIKSSDVVISSESNEEQESISSSSDDDLNSRLQTPEPKKITTETKKKRPSVLKSQTMKNLSDQSPQKLCDDRQNAQDQQDVSNFLQIQCQKQSGKTPNETDLRHINSLQICLENIDELNAAESVAGKSSIFANNVSEFGRKTKAPSLNSFESQSSNTSSSNSSKESQSSSSKMSKKNVIQRLQVGLKINI